MGEYSECDVLNGMDEDLPVFKKEDKSVGVIQRALKENVFVQHLLRIKGVLKAITDAMKPYSVPEKTIVIREGHHGDEMYVCESGVLNVYIQNNQVNTIESGDLFGEMALIYETRRKATVKSKKPCQLWVLHRKDYQKIIRRFVRLGDADYIAYLKSIPIFSDLDDECILNMWRVLRVDCYPAGAIIVKEGDDGSEFYVITGGTVSVSVKSSDGTTKQVAFLKRGDFFGEKALFENDRRAATVTAEHPGVECIVLDRLNFSRYLGQLKKISDAVKKRKAITAEIIEHNNEFRFIKLDDLRKIENSFIENSFHERVHLVEYNNFNRNEVFRLRMLKKAYVRDIKQQLMIERSILLSCNSPFVIRLYNTYKDKKYLYYLMESCLGGYLSYHLNMKKKFDENVSRFFSACIISALEYLHLKGIIYQALKPENLILDHKGYAKLVTFTQAKKEGTDNDYTDSHGSAYKAPEVILGKPGSKSSDCWSCGIIIYKLLVGKVPFDDDYNDEYEYEDEQENECEDDDDRSSLTFSRKLKKTDFPKYVSKSARSLIMKLCKQDPKMRVQMSDAKVHQWFENFDWESLHDQTMRSPYIPRLRSHTDCSNFQTTMKDKEIPPDDSSDWEEF